MDTLFRFEVAGSCCIGHFYGTYIAPDMVTAIRQLKCDGYNVQKIEELEMVRDKEIGIEEIKTKTVSSTRNCRR